MSMRRRRRHSFPGNAAVSPITVDGLAHGLLHSSPAAGGLNGHAISGIRCHSTGATSGGATASSPAVVTIDSEGRAPRKVTTTPWVCHICLDDVSSPVVTPCGHLFCWEHLHEWFTVASDITRAQCPVCKAPASASSVIPIYSVDGQDEDPREKPIPPRPRPAHSSTTTNTSASTSSPFHTFTVDAGIFGALPGFSMAWNWSNDDPGRVQAPHGMRRGGVHGAGALQEESFLRNAFSRIFIFLFFAFFVAITFSA